MKLELENVWTTVVSFPQLLDVETLTHLLHENGLDVVIEVGEEDSDGRWRRLRCFQPDQAGQVEVRRFSSEDLIVRQYGEILQSLAKGENSEDDWSQPLGNVRWVVQTVKSDGPFEVLAEWEFVLQACLSQPETALFHEGNPDPESSTGGSLWFFHNGDQVAFARTESQDPGEIVFQHDASGYLQAVANLET